MVTIAATDTSGKEPGTDTGTFRVTRSGDTTEAATIDFATSNGSATAGEDYDAASGTLTIPAN